MKLQRFPSKSTISATKHAFHSGELLQRPQGIPKVKLTGEELMLKLLDRRWALPSPDTKIHQIVLSSREVSGRGGPFSNIFPWNNTNPTLGANIVDDNQESSFYIVRDDLLHPLISGNKSRKLDALIPLVEDHLVTDMGFSTPNNIQVSKSFQVTCGGCQSAHAAAVAVSCAERRIKSHLLLRGEQPDIQTGYNLISTMYGNVTYVPRSVYASREKMLKNHADFVAGSSGNVIWLDDILEASLTKKYLNSDFLQKDVHRSDLSRNVVIVNEGAGDVIALLGVIRLVQYLSQNHLLGKERSFKFVLDAGTGTTAVGLGIGALCLGLPWEISAVMLADTIDGYRQQEKRLISNFKRHFGSHFIDGGLNELDGGIVHWMERCRPRKFGNVLEGEVEACQQIAQNTGVLVDPVYTLAAWEMGTKLSKKEAKGDSKVVMLHTGGTLGMFGLAQRYKSYFCRLKDGISI